VARTGINENDFLSTLRGYDYRMATNETTKIYVPGDFSFMENKGGSEEKKERAKMWSETCADGYKAVDKLDLWDWLSTYEPENGFMFCSHPNMDRITDALTFNPHSGASWGCMMRTMQKIAKYGWSSYIFKTE